MCNILFGEDVFHMYYLAHKDIHEKEQFIDIIILAGM